MPYPKSIVTIIALSVCFISAFLFHAAYNASGQYTQDIYFSLSYVVIMFCMMAFDLVRRIMQNEKFDHTQIRIDLILSSLKFRESSSSTYNKPGISDLLNDDVITEEDLMGHIQLPTTSDNYFEFRPQD
jgi:hypothetical protein